MFNEPVFKRKKINPKGLYISLLTFVLVLIIGVSYAFFIYEEEGNSHVAIAGNIFMESSDSGAVSLSGLYPMSDEDGIKNGIKYNFNVSGYNLSNKTIYYGIYVNEGDEVANKTRFRDNDIKLYLTKTIGDVTSVVYGPNTLEDFNRTMIYTSTIEPNVKKENAIDISYELTIWIDEKVLISDSITSMEGKSIYTSDGFRNSYASVNVEVYGDFQKKELPIIGYITYDLSSLGIINPASTPIYSDNTGTVTSEVTGATLTRFLGWSTTLGGEVVYSPGDTINVSDIINNNLTLYPVIDKESLADRVTSTLSLTSADSNGDRFVVGSADTGNEETDVKNFVWYSGKLWRIVKISSAGNVKLVTQGNMTTLAFNTSDTNADYSTSQMRSWLKNEFLPTLHNKENLLADSEWNYTATSNFPTQPIAKTSTLTDKIGLLNVYEFMMTGGGYYNSGTSDTYLETGYHWWMISPRNLSGTNIWSIADNGEASHYVPTQSPSVRPSINLKSNIKILEGTGTRSDPYIIEGDKETGVENELLNNRISGEYIKFDGVKYRIVGIENGLTKVTMADYDVNQNSLTASIKFGASSADITYNTSTGVGKYMYDWYNGTSITDTYKKMIATDGIVWYVGPTSGTGYNYTLSKTGTTVATPIGLGYYGEMFSTQFGAGTDSSASIWLMTKNSSSQVWIVYSYARSTTRAATDSRAARPSFYLKADVKITGGTGQEGSPYTISQ